MVANNIIEIYTLLFGWNMYEAIWDMMVGTGLAFIPFVVAIVSAFNSAFKPASSIALAQVELEVSIFAMIIVLMVCVLPFRLFGGTTMSEINYEIVVPDCNPPPVLTSGTGEATGTTHDGSYGPLAGYSVHPPAAWSLVMIASSAITNSAINSIACVNNYEFMLARISAMQLTDSEIVDRIKEFENVCYKPAVHQNNTTNPVPVIVNREATSAIDWIGSTIFLDTANLYYQDESAYMSLQDGTYGFARDPGSRDADVANPDSVNPSCKEIWEGDAAFFSSARGLREDIWDSLPVDVTGDVRTDFVLWGYEMFNPTATSRQKEDMLIRMTIEAQTTVMREDTDLQMGNEGLDAERDNSKAIFEWVVGAAGAITSPSELAQNLIVRTVAKNVAPGLAAFAQMLIILSAPLIMVFRSFKFTVFLQLAFMYFALEFLSLIWAIAFWFDNRLIQLFYQQTGSWTAAMDWLYLYMISLANYVGLPLMWLTLAGILGGGAIRGLSNDGGHMGQSTAAAFPRGAAKAYRNFRGGKSQGNSGGGSSKSSNSKQ